MNERTSKYNFKILFEKLEEEKKKQENELEIDLIGVRKVLDEIEYLKEIFDPEEENFSTYTRA